MTAPPHAGGLTSTEAAARLLRDGPNSLPRAKQRPLWRRLAGHLVEFFAVMLWVAAALALVAGMAQLSIAICVVVVLNAAFSFAQEYRAERAAAKLHDLLPRRASVRRDGEVVDVDAAELVVGDLVVLEPGDRVCADIRLASSDGLAVDTSMLSGESVPERPGAGDAVLAGTFVVEGAAEGDVTAIGAGTRLAEITALTSAAKRPRSPLARELDRVVRLISAIAISVGIAFFAIALLVGAPLSEGFLFAVGVTVALVPTAMLPTVTLSLAVGARRMAERNALVRSLEAVETLGSTTFICTDKTGTLTHNEMEVVEVWTAAGSAVVRGDGYGPAATVEAGAGVRARLGEAASAALAASTGRAVEEDGTWVARGDPMEAAIDALARRVDAVSSEYEVLARFPFDPRRRRMSVLLQGGTLCVKGAPDAVLPRCTAASSSGAAAAIDDLVRRGLRVLAVARRTGLDDAAARETDADAIEVGLDLLGLLGLEDPPRAEAAEALADCRGAGVRVAMVTGDHPGTAAAIAAEIGLSTDGSPVVEGAGLPDDDAALAELCDRDGVVFARVTPEDKLRIARALRSRGHVVAMTGDGVNDGPALQEADIGVAMGRSGTDVAREAADLVLLDDNFATIVAAVAQGRGAYANIRRFLTYHLTDNVAELTPFVVWALSAGRFPLALGVMQVLALDVGTDILPAVALGAEPPNERVMALPLGGSQGRHLLDGPVLRRVFALLGPIEAVFGMLAFVVALVVLGWRPGQAFPPEGSTALLSASGAAFSAVVLGQVANAFACRSVTLTPWKLGWTTNRILLWAVAAELALLAAVLWIEPIARVLGQAPPPPVAWSVALAGSAVLLGADVVYKRLRHRRGRRQPPRP